MLSDKASTFSQLLHLVLAFLFSVTIAVGQEHLPSDLDSGFADFLYSSEFYDLAGEEYERLLYYKPDDLGLLRKLIKCYAQTGQDNLLEKRFDLFQTSDRTIALDFYDLLISTGNSERLKTQFASQRHLFNEVEQNEIDFKIAISEYDWNSAAALYSSGGLDRYGPIMDRIEETKYKKPGLAAMLSTLVPGAGRIYAKDGKDGIISFIFVGSFAYQSYRRFRKNGWDSVGGWIYGGLALGFHVSNIYGSYQSAKYYNKKKDEKIQSFAMPFLVSDI